MERIPEPELMEDQAQALAYAQADFTETDTRFVDGFVERFGRLGGQILDLGCGPGNIAFPLAERLPDARVLGVDGSEAMLALAQAARGKHAAGERVEFRRAFLPDSGLPSGASAIVSNSLLHHLHDPQGLWESVKQCGAPGAPVWIGDLRRPQNVAQARALTQAVAADAPEVLRQDFYASLLAAFEPAEVREQLRVAGLGHFVVEVVGDRHLVVSGRLAGPVSGR